jgi:hypothetical protein
MNLRWPVNLLMMDQLEVNTKIHSSCESTFLIGMDLYQTLGVILDVHALAGGHHRSTTPCDHHTTTIFLLFSLYSLLINSR